MKKIQYGTDRESSKALFSCTHFLSLTIMSRTPLSAELVVDILQIAVTYLLQDERSSPLSQTSYQVANLLCPPASSTAPGRPSPSLCYSITSATPLSFTGSIRAITADDRVNVKSLRVSVGASALPPERDGDDGAVGRQLMQIGGRLPHLEESECIGCVPPQVRVVARPLR